MYPKEATTRAGSVPTDWFSIISQHRLVVDQIACGQKHLLLTATIAPRGDANMPLNDDEDDAGSKPHLLYGIGSNHSGQLGPHIPTYTNTITPLHVEDQLGQDATVVSVACGSKHSLILSSRGTVYACGDNSMGQLGISISSHELRTMGMASGKPNASSSSFVPITGFGSGTMVKQVFAAQHSSFALDQRGHLYAWGDPSSGQLAHGDNGERVDPVTLKTVTQYVYSPTLVTWFTDRHISIVEVAIGKTHLLCRSSTDVYAAGSGSFGKLGVGDVEPQFTPRKIKLTSRQPEQLISMACGDEHSLLLTYATVLDSHVIYFFGRLSNGDGQLTPTALAFSFASPYAGGSRFRQVFAGRGNQCAALSEDGLLWVWGKQPLVSNGTPASPSRVTPSVVKALVPFKVEKVVLGSTFVVAVASGFSERRIIETSKKEDDIINEEEPQETKWDIEVPQNDRVVTLKDAVPDEKYETGVRAFLKQFFASRDPTSALYTQYLSLLPTATPLSPHLRYQFHHVHPANLVAGDKLRLWMTDTYALAVVLPPGASSTGSPTAIKSEQNEEGPSAQGTRVQLQWLRDDWDDEYVELFSDDETLDDANPNRWQPFWYAINPEDGSYVLPHEDTP